jgi:hypothetical protein
VGKSAYVFSLDEKTLKELTFILFVYDYSASNSDFLGGCGRKVILTSLFYLDIDGYFVILYY